MFICYVLGVQFNCNLHIYERNVSTKTLISDVSWKALKTPMLLSPSTLACPFSDSCLQ